MSDILYKPSPESCEKTNMAAFLSFCERETKKSFSSYEELYTWSITDISSFWDCVARFSGIKWTKAPDEVFIPGKTMRDAQWFPGGCLNSAYHYLNRPPESIAIEFWGEGGKNRRRIRTDELQDAVGKLANGFLACGIKAGDRIAAFIPNIPEAVIGYLAAASIGAIFSTTSPDFGTQAVLDRFSQIEPRILIVADGYFYNGKFFDVHDRVNEIVKNLGSIEHVIMVDFCGHARPTSIHKGISWEAFSSPHSATLNFNETLGFNHPLCVVYSSGTTGKPKSIVHRSGGVLLQHLKELALHTDVGPGDRIFYFTTCGWMMWNWLVSSLATGATIVLYDGNPFFPNALALWDMVDELEITVFGTSARYLSALQKADVHPYKTHARHSLRAILSTGSPLSPTSFDYVYESIASNIMVSSICGGTDILSCFVLGNPILPVRRGFVQCRGLGMKVESFSREGKACRGVSGELVCTAPFPSMPQGFWGDDAAGSLYHKAYFDAFPDQWAHGDHIMIADDGHVQVLGRSDAVLNPGGVRIGTAELYRVVEAFEWVDDAIAVGQLWDGDERIVLFVKRSAQRNMPQSASDAEGIQERSSEERSSEERCSAELRAAIRQNTSPRHVPAKIIFVSEIPYTRNGKKLERVVRDIINGIIASDTSTILNPESLRCYEGCPELSS